MTEFSLKSFLPYRLSILSQTVSRLIAQEYENRFKLTMNQWRCLVIIHSRKNVTAKDICEHTLLDKMTVSRAIRALGSRKLITLSPSLTDARRQVITLSREGIRIYDEILPIAQNYEMALYDALSQREKKELDSIINKLFYASESLILK